MKHATLLAVFLTLASQNALAQVPTHDMAANARLTALRGDVAQLRANVEEVRRLTEQTVATLGLPSDALTLDLRPWTERLADCRTLATGTGGNRSASQILADTRARFFHSTREVPSTEVARIQQERKRAVNEAALAAYAIAECAQQITQAVAQDIDSLAREVSGSRKMITDQDLQSKILLVMATKVDLQTLLIAAHLKLTAATAFTNDTDIGVP